jgi:hypothetical protein
MDPNSARRVLELGFTANQQARVVELLAKLKAENITPQEREELEQFDKLNHQLTLLKSKVRKILRNNEGEQTD